MRNILIMLFVLLVPRIASAMDWYVYASSDPSEGRNTFEVSRSTDAVVVPFGKVNFECGVTEVERNSLSEILGLPEGYVPDYAYRELQCKFKDKSIIAVPISCTFDGDDSESRYILLKNKKTIYEVSVHCYSQEEDAPKKEPRYEGTDIEMKQYDEVIITCGEHAGIKGILNYLWKDSADIIDQEPSLEGMAPEQLLENLDKLKVNHYYVTDLKCIQKQ